MQFVVIGRDGTDEGALERRMAAREGHIAAFKDGLEKGRNIIGGALLNDNEEMAGSMMVVEFETRQALDEWLRTDPYVSGNVWQDIEIIPFKMAGKAK